MGPDLMELKELTGSYKNASVRESVSEDQVKPVMFRPIVNFVSFTGVSTG